MLQNFSEWRNATMQSAKSADMHYHLCDDGAWMDVSKFLRGFLQKRVNQGQNRFSIKLTDEFAEILLLFLTQMETAYMHPRSTSARILFRNLSLPANSHT